MVDGFEIVREYLVVTGTSLYTLNGTRVSMPELPQNWKNETSAIWFDAASGEYEPGAPVAEDIYTFHCYPGTNSLKDARTLARALHDRLHGANYTHESDGSIMTAWNVGGNGLNFREPETGYPVAVNQFRIRTV